MYSRDQIEQIRTATDIVEVVRSYVPSLKVSGRSVKGLCPFHGEKTASFHVHAEKAMFKCFGCGESGDVISFISKMEQASFTEALERLAAQAGIVLKKQENKSQSQEESLREKLFQVLKWSNDFYQKALWESNKGKAALSYLDERGIFDKTIEHFQLGFSPMGSEPAFEQLVKKGFTIDLCHKAGLVARSESGRYFDPMFGRLIFPIHDHFGHVVGFGGRIIPQKKKSILENEDQNNDGPKYLNSPETPVFSKGRLMYGLYQGKPAILRGRRALILEGYMDVIGAHQAGFDFSVATLGTALTGDHAKLLKRYSDEVVAFFDPDEAGQKAAMRGLAPIIQEDLFPRVVMPEGTQDPDEIIRVQGPQKFEEMVNTAPDFVDYILKTSFQNKKMDLQVKSQLANQILQIISKSPNAILKSEWTRKISAELNLNTDVLGAELKKLDRPSTPKPVVAKKGSTPRHLIPTVEEEYLRLVVNCPIVWKDLGIEEAEFLSDRNKKVFRHMKEQVLKSGRVSPASISDALEGDEKEWFMTLTMEEREFSDPSLLRDQLIRDIRKRKDKQRLAYLKSQIDLSQASTQEREEYLELLRRVKGSTHTLASRL